jgi:hypothetical protein
MATVPDTQQKVQRILAAEFSSVLLDGDGFRIEAGSTNVRIGVKDFGKDKDGNPSTVVTVSALVGRDITPTPEFYEWAATEGRQRYIGGVTVFKSKDTGLCVAVYDHALLGDYLDPAELVSAIVMCRNAADEFDEIVHDRFGGLRYTDPSPPPPEPPPAPPAPPAPAS